MNFRHQLRCESPNKHKQGRPLRAGTCGQQSSRARLFVLGGRVRYGGRPAATRVVTRNLVAAARRPARIDGAITVADGRVATASSPLRGSKRARNLWPALTHNLSGTTMSDQ